MAEQTGEESAKRALTFLEATLTERFKTASHEEAQQWIACMDGDALKWWAKSLWNMEQIKRAMAVEASR